MAKQRSGSNGHKKVEKRTKQGGMIRTSTMNKNEKRTFKQYRGQGRWNEYYVSQRHGVIHANH